MNRAVALAVGALVTMPVSAHHGGGTWDRNKNVELAGTITGIDFVNPHSWIYFDVVGSDGVKHAYRCEMRSATVLRRSGWTPEMFKAGEKVTITGRGDRVDERSCYLTTIVLADGSRTDRYGQLEKGGPVVAADRPVRLPSGEVRRVHLSCTATVGVVGNEQHQNVKIGKAGRSRHLGKRPSVRGVVMNAVDHPHGGGDGGRHRMAKAPRTPWGQKTLGYKTRRRKATNNMIVRSRHLAKRKKG